MLEDVVLLAGRMGNGQLDYVPLWDLECRAGEGHCLWTMLRGEAGLWGLRSRNQGRCACGTGEVEAGALNCGRVGSSFGTL